MVDWQNAKLALADESEGDFGYNQALEDFKNNILKGIKENKDFANMQIKDANWEEYIKVFADKFLRSRTMVNVKKCPCEHGRGKPTTEFYDNGKPQIYCMGWVNNYNDEPLECCKTVTIGFTENNAKRILTKD